jgi:hypothetical protein
LRPQEDLSKAAHETVAPHERCSPHPGADIPEEDRDGVFTGSPGALDALLEGQAVPGKPERRWPPGATLLFATAVTLLLWGGALLLLC